MFTFFDLELPLEILVYLAPLILLVFAPQFRREFFHRDFQEAKIETNETKQTTIPTQAKTLAQRPESKTSRLPFFDFIRGIAILGVILIHVVHFFQLPGTVDHPEIVTNTINNVFRFAIPIFLIVSGILLNPDDLKTPSKIWHFYRRKLLRIFLPYLIIAWLVAETLYGYLPLGDKLYLVLSGNLLVPYYFIILLLQLYLIYPLLVRLSKHKYFLEGCLVISFVAGSIPELSIYEGFILFPRFLFFFAYGIKLRGYFLEILNSNDQDRRLNTEVGVHSPVNDEQLIVNSGMGHPESQQDAPLSRSRFSQKIGGIVKQKKFNPFGAWWIWPLLALHYLIVSTLINEHLYNLRFFYGVAVFHLLLWIWAKFFLLWGVVSLVWTPAGEGRNTPLFRGVGGVLWVITFLGRQSLIIYLTHFLFIQFFFVSYLNKLGWFELFITTSTFAIFSSTLVALIWGFSQKALNPTSGRPKMT